MAGKERNCPLQLSITPPPGEVPPGGFARKLQTQGKIMTNPQNLSPAPGEEQFEISDGGRVSYEYRAEDGALFSCIAPSIEEARSMRDSWKARRGGAEELRAHMERQITALAEKPSFIEAAKRQGLKTPEEIRALALASLYGVPDDEPDE